MGARTHASRVDNRPVEICNGADSDRLIAGGLSNKQIASRLKISERTVEAHVDHIRNKLQIHSRAQIAAWATKNGQASVELGIPTLA